MRLSEQLACLAVLAVGCMKSAPPAGVPTLVVPVTAVSGSALSLMATADAPRAAPDPEGQVTGAHVEVEWQGYWLPATLLERHGERWLVHYESPGLERDEVVERKRIRTPAAVVDEAPSEPDVDP